MFLRLKNTMFVWWRKPWAVANPWNWTKSRIHRILVSDLLWYSEKTVKNYFVREWLKLSDVADVSQFVRDNRPWKREKRTNKSKKV